MKGIALSQAPLTPEGLQYDRSWMVVRSNCVIIETPSKGNANIRRVASTYCDPASAEVVDELQDEMLEEAEECAAAKSELATADTDDAVDRALRKISILCDM